MHIYWGGTAQLPAGGLNALNALQKQVWFFRPKEISIYFIFRLSSSVLGTQDQIQIKNMTYKWPYCLWAKGRPSRLFLLQWWPKACADGKYRKGQISGHNPSPWATGCSTYAWARIWLCLFSNSQVISMSLSNLTMNPCESVLNMHGNQKKFSIILHSI